MATISTDTFLDDGTARTAGETWTGSAVTDTWMRINSAVDMGTYYAYFVEIMSGSLPVTYRAGSAAAGYGKPGEGAIRLSADDPYGPLIDIFTTGAQPWAADVYPHVRLGRLDGVGVPGLSGIRQYGIALGTNLADATLPYMFASNLGVRQYNIDSAWNDGANDTVRIEAGGRARFGTNVDTALGTFLDINPAAGLATFRGAIEVLAGSSGYGNLTDKPTLGTMAAIDNSLDNVNNGSTYARVNSTIISGGNIRVGSGTKDSTLNGWNIDSGEIVGQASGVDQVVMGTDGAISAGAGNVNLDASGIWVEAPIDATATVSSYRFKDEVYGYEIGGIYGLSAFSTVPLKAHNILIEALATGTTGGDIRIEANAAALGGGNIQLVGNVDCESIANIRTTSSAW